MSAATEPTAPPTPHPAGVIDLGRYRGRAATAPVVVPPPPARPDAPPAEPVLVPDRRAAGPRPSRPEAAPASGEVSIRHLRLGSVLRMAFGLALCTYVVVLGAGVLVWITIAGLGVVDNVESLAEDLGWVDVAFDGPAMLRAAAIGGGVLVVGATVLAVVFAEVFNLLSTITGGLRAEIGPPPVSRRRRRRAARRGRRAHR